MDEQSHCSRAAGGQGGWATDSSGAALPEQNQLETESRRGVASADPEHILKIFTKRSDAHRETCPGSANVGRQAVTAAREGNSKRAEQKKVKHRN